MAPKAKRAAFAREYPKDRNATQAAIRAGYSAKTAGQIGHDLLKIPEVAAAIAATETKAADEAGITVAEIIEGLKSEAKGADQASARVQAWVALGKYKAMFTEKTEHSVPGGVSITISGVRK